VYVQTVSLEHFRCFERAEARFIIPDPGGDTRENINLILGINGSGKTTLMRAVCLGLIADVLPSSGFLPRNFVRLESGGSGASNAVCRADVTLHAVDNTEKEGRSFPFWL